MQFRGEAGQERKYKTGCAATRATAVDGKRRIVSKINMKTTEGKKERRKRAGGGAGESNVKKKEGKMRGKRRMY